MHRAPPPASPPRHNSTPSTEEPTLNPLETTLSYLWVLTPLAATVSLLVVFLGMVTNQWLHTEEKMVNPKYNGTGEGEYLSKFTYSGLWKYCYTNPPETFYECKKVDYFPEDDYTPDPSDSTMAIPYTVTKCSVFFIIASIMLCGAYVCSIIGQCVRHKTLYTFISGVVFIVAGLVMLFGLIMYISVFKSEIGSKLRPQSQLQLPIFEYWYGYSFLLFVFGLIATHLAGICSIFLFIYKIQYEWRKKHSEELKRGKRPATGRAMNTYHHDPTMYYPCRRHPQAYVNSNSAIHHNSRSYPSPGQKRYYFSKENLNDSPCSIHRTTRSQSNSLKDLSSPSFYNFPPPPTISYQFDEPFNRDSLRHFPLSRDITTNTVSTTADVNCDDFIDSRYDDFSPSVHGNHSDFVTFDLDQALPLRAPSCASISSRNGGGGRKGFESDALRRTTPV